MKSFKGQWWLVPVIIFFTVNVCMPAFAGKKRPAPASPLTVCDLRTERMADPMSIDTPAPRLGWRLEATEQEVMQTAYHIIVASTREKAEALEGDLWDATVESAQSQWVRYGGKPLKSNSRCYWRVKVSGECGSQHPLSSDWSTVAMWNVGLLAESDWRGQWIGYNHLSPWDREEEHSRLSSRYLRTAFTLDKPLRQATLYVCGLGLYECFIDGRRVGDQVLAPMPTDYRKTVLFNAYDVTPLLGGKDSEPAATTASAAKAGPLAPGSQALHAIAVVLGNGRYYTMQQKKKPYKITHFGLPTLRLNLILDFEDGSRKVVATDEKTWRVNVDGALRSNNEYDGEVYDARKSLDGWMLPGYDDSGWPKAERTAIPYGTLRGQMSPGMKVVSTLRPKSVTHSGDKLIVDMGQNMAGWLKVRLPLLAEGDSVVIRYAERLDSTGNIWTENLRHAQSTDRYFASGREPEDTWWHPVFSYHGFRYAEVSGLLGHASAADGAARRTPAVPSCDDFIGEGVSDAMEATGHFVSSDTILNKVYQNACWGVLSNYKGMPVDCPQRDERQPWLGDRTRGCFGEAFLFDNHTLYAKWARDICEAQREDGCIPDVAPAFWNYYSDDLTWAAALPMTLAMLAGHYGDDEPLRRCYPNVKRWLHHMKDCYQRDGLMHCGKYADWCVPPEREEMIHSEDPARKTDVTLISSAYYYHICRMMAGWARMQRLEADASWLDEEARLTKAAFNRTFLTAKRGTSKVPGHVLYPDSTFYGNNTVTANLLPYYFGMIDDAYVRQEVGKQIVKKLTDEGAITTGVIGTGWLLHALTSMGRTDLAWLLATNRKYPSWGYMAEHGATTIWELWNGDTASPKMNSGNHVMLLGDLLAWLYEDIAGIGAGDVGFKHITMKPDFSVDEIDNIDASYESIYGRIVSRWRKEHGQLLWHIELPPNTTATAVLPDGTMRQLGSGSHDLTCHLSLSTSSSSLITPPPSTITPQIVCDEFIYKDAPFPSCHSATIVETRKGDLVATFFGGTKERNPDVSIWVSRKPKGSQDWTAPVLVADGVEPQPLQPDKELKRSQVSTPSRPFFNAQFLPLPQWTGNFGALSVTADGRFPSPEQGAAGTFYREACWNPVLFETPDGVLHLYFKIGPNVAGWKGWRIASRDGGKTWSQREPLPDDIYGPIKNKPLLMSPERSAAGGSAGNARLISPTSDERDGWKCYFELSDNLGTTWRRTAFVQADSGVLAIQPTIIVLPDGRLEALCRTRSRHIGVTFSSDDGETWSKLQLIDTPNNNSGIDAVTTFPSARGDASAGGDVKTVHYLICNDWPIEPDKQKGARTPLSILRSDDGLHWSHWVTLEDSPISQYSYPSIIQTSDGHLHAIYTWRRQRIKHVELVP